MLREYNPGIAMRWKPSLLVLVLAATALAGCAQDAPAPGTADTDAPSLATQDAGDCVRQILANLSQERAPRGQGTVTMLTHDSFSVPQSVLDAFTNETGIAVRLVKMGDAGEALNKAILQKDAPVGDVLFGVDNALIHRAAQHGLFQPYASPRLADVDERHLAPFCAEGRMLATPVDYGYVQLNYDVGWFQERNLSLPADLKDVANATYAPLTVVTNPHTSSPGFAFLLATIDRFGAEGGYDYRAWWSDFAKNGGRIVPGWEQAYGEEFTQGYAEGGARDRPIVLSYSTSPAYVPMNGWGEATTANLDLPKGAWLQVEAAGILGNAPNPEGARALLDHMLGASFQENASFSMVVYPVHADAKPAEAYREHAPEPREPARLPADQIEANRDAWLRAWKQATGQA